MLVLTACVGCTSIKTKQTYRASDGKFSVACLPWQTKGVPCKFKMETGVRVKIDEHLLIDKESGKLVRTDSRILDVTTEVIESDQIFIVHVPRPLAGTLDLNGDDKKGFHYTNGYLTSVGGKIDDTTIEDITDALGAESIGGVIKTASITDPGEKFLKQSRTVAVREFSFADPNWSYDMNVWIEDYMGPCNKLCAPSSETVETVCSPAIGMALQQ